MALPRRRREPGAQNLGVLGEDVVLILDQRAHHLPLGDADAGCLQQRDQPLHRHLALVVLPQQETARFRAEVATNALRQLALELRTRRHLHADHLGLDGDSRRHFAAPAATLAPLAAALRLGRVFHATRLDRRPALQPLQPGDLIALRRRHQPLQLGNLAQQLRHSSFQRGPWHSGKVGGR
jgi:hypothetical protein